MDTEGYTAEDYKFLGDCYCYCHTRISLSCTNCDCEAIDV